MLAANIKKRKATKTSEETQIIVFLDEYYKKLVLFWGRAEIYLKYKEPCYKEVEV